MSKLQVDRGENTGLSAKSLWNCKETW
jgi:hypothetical protein